MNPKSFVLLTARDPALIEAVEALALALGVPIKLVQESDELAQRWPHAQLRLVAPDMAARAAWLGHQPATVLVGRDADELAVASAELGYSVVPLPAGSSRLADMLAAAMTSTGGQALVVSIVGASGGLGTSTCAIGLGSAAAAAGRNACVVELAPRGGGLDLLAGVEMAEGVRWSELKGASGQFGDVHDALVRIDNVALLPLSRDDPGLPGPVARRSVLDALRRSMDVIVVDSGSDPHNEADLTLFVVGADVRGVAAARMLSAETGVSPGGLVVRTGDGRNLRPTLVAETLGARLAGSLGHDRALPRLSDMGASPHSAPAKRFRRDVARLWQEVERG